MTASAAGRIRARHSIRARVLAATCIVSLGGFLFTGLSLRTALTEWQEARSLQAASAALATLSRATTELSLERSASQVAMQLTQPADATLRGLIEGQRRKADAGLDSAMQQGGATGTGRSEEFRAGIGALRNRLTPLRADIDRMIAAPPATRPAERIERLQREQKAIVAAFQAERHLLRGPGYRLPTEVAILETIRDQAWQAREYGGRERTYLAIAAANRRSIDEATLGEMGPLARRVEDAWRDVQHLSRYEGLPEPVRVAVRSLAETYFGRYARLRGAMLVEATSPEPGYPVDFARFFAESSEALGTAEALAEAASQAIEAFWEARARATLAAVVIDAVAVLLLLATAILGGLLTIRAFRRLDEVRRRMEALAGGELEPEVPEAGARDEVGAMARALLIFRETALQRRQLEAKAAEEQAERDRRQAAMERHTRDFTESLSGIMRGLSAAAQRMDAASAGMAEVASRTGDLARATTEGAKGSARDLSTVAAATEELTTSVAEISRQVAGAAAAAQGMASHAGQTEQTMAGLAQAAERVGDVARLIGDIAGQTNLLALNATIEAARAGEAGKGFAVVASEVKQLASRTATATEEIAGQIQAIQGATHQAVEAVRTMASEVRRMEEMAGGIAAAVEQQGAGVREIAAGITTVTRSTEAAVDAMGEATAAAEEARQASAEVRDAAGEIGRESGNLGQELQHFLHAMREDCEDRRVHHRAPGADAPARLDLADGTWVEGQIVDVSASGFAMRPRSPEQAARLVPGQALMARLPGLDRPVPVRVVRAEPGLVGLIARDAPADALEAVIAGLPGQRRAA